MPRMQLKPMTFNNKNVLAWFEKAKQIALFPYRESNPGRLGESQES